ncbi:hypothetical protein HY065_02795 [Candidatus Berkelbacteria bacterium]|nr:hypothetical protein [Candidatus Berkelbacteria bacterium]
MPHKEVWTLNKLGDAMDKLGDTLETLARYVVEHVAAKAELQEFKNEVYDRFDEEHNYNKCMHNELVAVLEKQRVIPTHAAERIRRF